MLQSTKNFFLYPELFLNKCEILIDPIQRSMKIFKKLDRVCL